MGEVNNIAILDIMNDIFKYDVSLNINQRKGKFHVSITWIGITSKGSAMGNATGCNEMLYLALSEAYQDMLLPKKKNEKE